MASNSRGKSPFVLKEPPEMSFILWLNAAQWSHTVQSQLLQLSINEYARKSVEVCLKYFIKICCCI